MVTLADFRFKGHFIHKIGPKQIIFVQGLKVRITYYQEETTQLI